MQYLADDRAKLRPGHVRAQTKVHPAAAETDVRVGAATQVQAVGMLEHVGVEVAG